MTSERQAPDVQSEQCLFASTLYEDLAASSPASALKAEAFAARVPIPIEEWNAGSLGNHSFNMLLIGHAEQAVQYSARALQQDDSQHWIRVNHMLALTLTGRVDEAVRELQQLANDRAALREISDALEADLKLLGGLHPRDRDLEHFRKAVERTVGVLLEGEDASRSSTSQREDRLSTPKPAKCVSAYPNEPWSDSAGQANGSVALVREGGLTFPKITLPEACSESSVDLNPIDESTTDLVQQRRNWLVERCASLGRPLDLAWVGGRLVSCSLPAHEYRETDLAPSRTIDRSEEAEAWRIAERRLRSGGVDAAGGALLDFYDGRIARGIRVTDLPSALDLLGDQALKEGRARDARLLYERGLELRRKLEPFIDATVVGLETQNVNINQMTVQNWVCVDRSGAVVAGDIEAALDGKHEVRADGSLSACNSDERLVYGAPLGGFAGIEVASPGTCMATILLEGAPTVATLPAERCDQLSIGTVHRLPLTETCQSGCTSTDEHPSIIHSYNRLARLQLELNDRDYATELNGKALELSWQNAGTGHALWASAALVTEEMGGKGFPWLTRVVRGQYGDAHPFLLPYLMRAAGPSSDDVMPYGAATCAETDNPGQCALHYLDNAHEAIRVSEAFYGAGSPEWLAAQERLALVYFEADMQISAMIHAGNVVAWTSAYEASDLFTPSDALQMLTSLYRSVGAASASEEAARQLLKEEERRVSALIDGTSQQELRNALDWTSPHALDAYLSVRGDDTAATYEALLRWHGVSLRSLLEKQRAWVELPEPSIALKGRELGRLRSEESELVLDPRYGGPDAPVGARRDALVDLQRRISVMESDLSSAAARPEGWWFDKQPAAKEICEALPSGATLVDYKQMQRWWGSPDAVPTRVSDAVAIHRTKVEQKARSTPGKLTAHDLLLLGPDNGVAVLDHLRLTADLQKAGYDFASPSSLEANRTALASALRTGRSGGGHLVDKPYEDGVFEDVISSDHTRRFETGGAMGDTCWRDVDPGCNAAPSASHPFGWDPNSDVIEPLRTKLNAIHTSVGTWTLDAFVMQAGQCDTVKRVPLGHAADIGWLVQHYRNLVGSPSLPDMPIDSAGSTLRAVLWDPVAGAVRPDGLVFVVLDGVVSALPLAALPGADGRYLIEDHSFHHLTHASELVRISKLPELRSTGLLAVGGVTYGGPGEPLPAAPDGDTRAAPCVEAPFRPLPGTRTEVDFIGKYASDRLGRNHVKVLTAQHASESRIAEEASEYRFLHIATHGFFASGACKESLATVSKDPYSLFGGEVIDHDYDPLALSGLILAGANDRNKRPDGTPDGVWTALEVASQDLSNTELVVLSACETGLGEVEAGEGVLGLQRAFLSAGTRTILMSLWAVDDEATRSLMESFYRHRFGDVPMSETAALRAAQLDLLARNRSSGRARPGTWGAFFAVGDWK